MSAARAFLLALLGLWLALAASTAGAEERRIALVIGNAKYQNVPPLLNPGNDADDLAAALRGVGFEVIEGRDLDKRSMEAEFLRFARLARDADAALFFYAGHGLQHQNQNYLMPVDAKLEDELNLPFEMTRLDDVLGALGRARGIRLLVLDACRNNPLADKLARATATREFANLKGLARIEGTQGMLVAYSAQANHVAVDGGGRNSPFTEALLREIPAPGVEVATVFRRVALAVNRATGGQQTPELILSLLGEFYFKPLETDTQVWTRIRANGDPQVIAAFIARYPTSLLVDAAKARLDALQRHTERVSPSLDAAERDRQPRGEMARLETERPAVATPAAPALDANAARSERNDAPAIPAAVEKEPERAPPAVEKRQQRAALPQPSPEAAPAPARPPVLAGPALVMAIRKELKRLGCAAGRDDEGWHSAATARALRNVGRYASLPEVPSAPTLEFLNALRGKPARVCPLVCGTRQIERHGRCTAKLCPAGERLDEDGDCAAVEKPKPVVRPLVCGPRQIERHGRCTAKLCPAGERLDEDGDCAAVQKPKPVVRPRVRVVQPIVAPRVEAPEPVRPRPRVERPTRVAPPRPAAGGGGRHCFDFGGRPYCE